MKNTSAKPSGPLRMSFSAATRLASIVSGSFTFSKPEKAQIYVHFTIKRKCQSINSWPHLKFEILLHVQTTLHLIYYNCMLILSFTE